MRAVGGERLRWWLHPLRVTPQYLAFFCGCLAFLHRHFLSQSPPSHPLNLSLSSQQQPLPWDCSTIPRLQLPGTAPSSRLASLSGECVAAARTVWFSFHLGCHRSAVSLSALNVSPLTQAIADVGIRPLLQFPHPSRAGPVLLTLPFFPPRSVILLSFVWVSIFFSTGQVLLSALSWCSACTSVSEGAFLMHPWGQMYSTSTYCSAILFSPWKLFECNFLAWYFEISRWYPLMWLWFSHFPGIYNTLGSTYWYLDLGIFSCHLYFLPFFFLFSLFLEHLLSK